MTDYSDDKSSVFQDKDGNFSLSQTMDNFRSFSSAVVVIGIFIWGLVSAVNAWGVYFGLFFGTLVSGAVAFGLFAIIVLNEWAQWAALAIVTLAILLVGLPIILL